MVSIQKPGSSGYERRDFPSHYEGSSSFQALYRDALTGREEPMTTSVMNQISARNQISGRVADIQAGQAMSIVTVSADGHTIVSAITNQAVHELGLKKNDSVVALVKSTEAMIAKGE